MAQSLLRVMPDLRRSLVLASTLGAAQAASAVLQTYLLAFILSTVYLHRAPLTALTRPLFALLAAILLRAILQTLFSALNQVTSSHTRRAIRLQVFDTLAAIGPRHSLTQNPSDLVTLAVDGVERLDAYLSRYLPQRSLTAIVPAIILLAIAWKDWLSAFFLLIMLPILPILMVLVGRYTAGRTERQWQALSRLSARLLDAIQGLSTLVMLDRVSAERARIQRLSNRYRDTTLSVLQIAFLSGLTLEFLIAAAIGLIAVALGTRLLNGSVSFQTAAFILLLTPELFRPLRTLGAARHAALEGQEAWQRLAPFLTPPPSPSTPSSQPVPSPPFHIHVSNISFRYTPTTPLLLNNVSFSLEPCSHTALIGPSGAGKSTLLLLFARLLDPISGTITVNGLPLSSFSPVAWRDHLALLPQHPRLFRGTLRENLLAARTSATTAELYSALERAHLHEFLSRLPHGLDTPLGEGYATISAGELQRLALARVLLKNTPLLLFDEPSAALDSENTTLLRELLRELARERSIFTVAHSPTLLAHADRVFLLREGHLSLLGDGPSLFASATASSKDLPWLLPV